MRCGVWFLLMACWTVLSGCRSVCSQPVVIPSPPVLPFLFLQRRQIDLSNGGRRWSPSPPSVG